MRDPMDFILATVGMVGFIVLGLVLLARAYPGSGADLVDWKPARDYETELQLEQDDLAQMLEAQNAYRRRRGAAELTEADAHAMAREDERVRQHSREVAVRQIAERKRIEAAERAARDAAPGPADSTGA